MEYFIIIGISLVLVLFVHQVKLAINRTKQNTKTKIQANIYPTFRAF